MFSPSLQQDSLGMSRREHAQNRAADAMHDLLEWSPAQRTPAASGFHVTRERIEPRALSRRVVWSGRFWMSDEPVAAWRPAHAADDAKQPFRPVSDLAARAARAGVELKPMGPNRGQLLPKAAPVSTKKATCFDELALEPIDGMEDNAEMTVVGRLAELELRVEVVKFVKPAADATGASTGRVLAVSENYSAQDVGHNRVVIHQNKDLDRPVHAGEKVTLAYQDGKTTVYDGLAHDVKVVADWMPREQQTYMRMVMLDALSMMKAPQSDEERLQDALRYALESTANFFGLGETKLRRADIELVVNEKAAAYGPDGNRVEAPNRLTSAGPAP